jgi:predicted amidohydrolase
MDSTFKVACVQNCAEADLERNIADCEALTREAAAAGARLICLPEHFACLTRNDADMLAAAVPEAAHPALDRFRVLARELRCWLLLGSLAIKLPGGKINNRSFLIDDAGGITARYDKAHLFDVTLKGGETYLESSAVEPGNSAVIARLPWGNLGMSVCYDLRFAYLYRMLAQGGAEFLSIPAAFTRTTGVAHWHVLVRARAIETGCFVFAPGQCGVRSWGRATFGHSLIVDPWGAVLAEAGDEQGYVIAEVDPARVAEVRAMIPSLRHDRDIRPPTKA